MFRYARDDFFFFGNFLCQNISDSKLHSYNEQNSVGAMTRFSVSLSFGYQFFFLEFRPFFFFRFFIRIISERIIASDEILSPQSR